jgi:hypothetical protein
MMLQYRGDGLDTVRRWSVIVSLLPIIPLTGQGCHYGSRGQRHAGAQLASTLGRVIQPEDLWEGKPMSEQLPIRIPQPVTVVQHVPVDPALLARVRDGLMRLP